MNLPESNRLAYEIATLANVETSSELTIEEFVGLPTYVDGQSSEDTWYDGSIVRMEVVVPRLAPAGAMLIELLGPYWDRVFRCRVDDASSLVVTRMDLLRIPQIHHIDLGVDAEGARYCVLRTYNEGQEIRFNYGSARVERLMLRERLDRRMMQVH